MTTLSEISAQLAEPFAVEDIDLLPKGKIERDGKTLCMALAYADPRVYQDRLNTLAPGEWETPPPIALNVGDKLICYVTVIICGVRHTDAGEAGPGENQGTEAFSQAFKRACSQFGLGRYLYGLDKQWVPYDPRRKQIDLDAAGIQNVVRKMYAQARIPMAVQQRQARTVESTSNHHAVQGNASKSQGEPNLTAQKPPAPITPPATVAASSDSTASASGHIAAPSAVERVKDGFVEVYGVAEADIEKRWPNYKKHILGSFVADPDMTLAQVAMLNGDIVAQRKKIAGKAS